MNILGESKTPRILKNMIISHQNRYLFVEIPHTGSTAISHELRANYHGEKILKKHSFYSDFLKIASPDEKKYLVFAGIRNPLDETVTRYFKTKGNFQQNEVTIVPESRETELSEEFHSKGMDFPTFFMKHYKVPYNNFSCLVRDHYDYLIRFENLQADFARLLQILGLELKRPLQIRNSTQARRKDFLSYYSPSMIPRAKKVFGPFMEQWGYEFPKVWGNYSPTWWSRLEYEGLSRLLRLKWQTLRFMTKSNRRVSPIANG
jgi:hypothetical protein